MKEKESDRETPSQTVEAAEEEARYFLETLQHHAHKLQGVQVIALSLSYFEYETQHFTDALSHLIQSEELPPLIQNVKVIDTETFLERGDYFILDNHLDELGHKKIAASILAELDTQ